MIVEVSIGICILSNVYLKKKYLITVNFKIKVKMTQLKILDIVSAEIATVYVQCHWLCVQSFYFSQIIPKTISPQKS